MVGRKTEFACAHYARPKSGHFLLCVTDKATLTDDLGHLRCKAGHFWKAFQSGYDTMLDKELKQRARWDIYLLILRALAMFMMAAHGLVFFLVPADGTAAELS